METITIELRNKNVLNLLKELEQLNFIKLLQSTSNEKSTALKPSQMKGFLSHTSADKLLKHISEGKNEREQRFPAK